MCGLAVKLEDDGKDEKGLRRHVAKILGKTLSPLTDKAVTLLNSLQFPTGEVVDALKEQDSVESRQPDLYEASEPTSRAYQTIFRHGAVVADCPDQKEHLGALGRSLGRLIYWKDAHDDLEKDQKKGRFNPLVNRPPEELQSEFEKELGKLRDACDMDGHFHETLDEVMAVTLSKHQALLPQNSMMMSSTESRKKKRDDGGKKSCGDWCDCFCPCREGSCADSAVDCGPGDTGCCDCDCCP